MRIRELGGVNAFHEDRHEVMAESWLESIKDYLGVNSAMADWTFAWMLDENMELVKFLNALKVKQSVLMKQAIIGKVIRCIGSLAITIVDNGSDFLLAADYFRRGDASWGKLTISFPLTSNILQCLFATADKDSIIVTFLALFGLKPFIDTWRTVTSAPQGTRRFNPVLSMAVNRGIELIFESTPQTFFQTFRIIRSTAEHEIISSMQYATLIISFLAIGFIFTIVDYEMDTSERYRKIEPQIYGCIPSSKAKACSLHFYVNDPRCSIYSDAHNCRLDSCVCKSDFVCYMGSRPFRFIHRGTGLSTNVQIFWASSDLHEPFNERLWILLCVHRGMSHSEKSLHDDWSTVYFVPLVWLHRCVCYACCVQIRFFWVVRPFVRNF